MSKQAFPLRSFLAAPAMALVLALAIFFGTAPSHASPPQPKTVANVFNTPILANADVFPAVTPTAQRGSVAYRLTIGLTATNSVVNLRIDDGSTPTNFALNNGNVLMTNQVYTFVWGANSAYSYTLQYGTATTSGYVLLEEVKDGEL